jgi:hypothetical protein
MILGRLRLLRRTRELVDLVRDLRRVERAEVLIESGPIDVPWETQELAALPPAAAPDSSAPVAITEDQPTERQHAPCWILGG